MNKSEGSQGEVFKLYKKCITYKKVGSIINISSNILVFI